MSHKPIGPCGPLEQAVDVLRQSLMAARSSALSLSSFLDSGVNSVGAYYRGQAVEVRVRVVEA